MRVLVACEFSGIVRDAFTALGHFAVSCDLLPTERPGEHYIGEAEYILDMDWDLLIAHPPCTYLANSGVCHLYKDESRWQKMRDGAALLNLFLNCDIPRVAVENPIMHRHGQELLTAKYTQIVQPWQFGHEETKGTCLWLKNLPKLTHTQIMDVRVPRSHREGPGTANGDPRWKRRSRTYQGIANAMAHQWGSLC